MNCSNIDALTFNNEMNNTYLHLLEIKCYKNNKQKRFKCNGFSQNID